MDVVTEGEVSRFLVRERNVYYGCRDGTVVVKGVKK